MPDKPSEKPEKKTTEKPSEPPHEEPSKPKVTCNHCGAKVIPTIVESGTGPRLKCPKCGKLMKPQEEIDKEREERGPLPPLELQMVERLKELLTPALPRVFGIPKKEASKTIGAIVDTLNPTVAMNPMSLHNHIKTFAPNAADRHLESIIRKIYSQLENEGYLPQRGSPPYYPGYSSQRPRYTPRDFGYPPPQYPQYPDYREYRQSGEREYPPPYPPQRPQSMKTIVDGQEIVTDFAGYMAWERWKEEKESKAQERANREAAETRQSDEHELLMKKLDEEIKKIARETGGSKNDELVEVPFGEDKIKVPASLAHLYLKKGEDPKLAKLEEKINSLAEENRALKEEERKRESDEVNAELAALNRKIENQPTFKEQLQEAKSIAELTGYSKSGPTTLSLLKDMGEKADERVGQVLNRMPDSGEGEFKPDVKRTPKERRETAKQLGEKLEKKKEVLKAEDDLLHASGAMG